jgi:hypothetical protein
MIEKILKCPCGRCYIITAVKHAILITRVDNAETDQHDDWPAERGPNWKRDDDEK